MAENITYDWYYDSRARKVSSIIKKKDEIVGEFFSYTWKNWKNVFRVFSRLSSSAICRC